MVQSELDGEQDPDLAEMEERDEEEDRVGGAIPGTQYLLSTRPESGIESQSEVDPEFAAIREEVTARYAYLIEQRLQLRDLGDYEGDDDLKYGQSELVVGDLLDRLVEILDVLPQKTVQGFQGIFQSYAESSRFLAIAMCLEKLSRPGLEVDTYPRDEDKLLRRRMVALRENLSRGELLLIESVLIGAFEEAVELSRDRSMIHQVAGEIMRAKQRDGGEVQARVKTQWFLKQVERRANQLAEIQKRQRRALRRCRATWKVWGDSDERLAGSVEKVRRVLFSVMYQGVVSPE